MKRRGGFTLIELLVAAIIMAVMLASLYGVYRGATQLRERVWGDIQTSVPIDEVIRVIRADLGGAVSPGSVLAKPFTGQSQQDGKYRRDTLDFGCSTGKLLDDKPWGDVIQVHYALVEPEDGNTEAGMDLGRTVTRNLLAQTVTTEPVERLLHNVDSLQLQYWDGQFWNDSWDSSANDNKVPPTIKMRIDFAPPAQGKLAMRPLELVCQTVCDNTTQSTTTSTGGTE